MAKIWEYGLREIFGNTAARIMLILYLFGVIGAILFTVNSFSNEMDAATDKEFARLQSVSSTLAKSIDPEAHSQLLNDYVSKDDITSTYEDPRYARLSSLLQEVKASNGLETDIYTLFQEEGKFYFGVSSAQNPYFRHEWMHPHEEHRSDYDLGSKVGPYEDENGTWLSSFSPIKDENGETRFLIQADRQFDTFQAEVYKSTWEKVILEVAVLLLVSMVVIFFLKKVLKQDEVIKAKLLQQSMELEASNRDFLDSLNVAKRIQEALIPSDERIQKELVSFFKFYRPKDVVSGDFLWHKKVDSRIYLAVGDCTGHGIPGALMSMMGSSALDLAISKGADSPAIILDRLEGIVKNNFKSSGNSFEAMDIAICAYDEVDGTFSYAGAMRPLLLISGQSVRKIKGDKKSIGSSTAERYTNKEIKVAPGDRIYLYSDGYQDQFGGEKGKKYMSKNFEFFISSIQSHTMAEQSALLAYEFHLWKEKEFQVDDVLVAGFQIPEPLKSLKVA